MTKQSISETKVNVVCVCVCACLVLSHRVKLYYYYYVCMNILCIQCSGTAITIHHKISYSYSNRSQCLLLLPFAYEVCKIDGTLVEQLARWAKIYTYMCINMQDGIWRMAFWIVSNWPKTSAVCLCENSTILWLVCKWPKIGSLIFSSHSVGRNYCKNLENCTHVHCER